MINKKLLIIIPVYNEQDVIKDVLNDWISLQLDFEFKLLIIDDGSKDNSLKIINQISKQTDKIIKFNRVNSGHGNTILFGYKYAVKNNYDLIFQTDSDNQFKANDFKKLLDQLNTDSDLILGNRKGRKDGLVRLILTKIFLRFLIFILFGKFIIDPNVPYRLITKTFLKNFLDSLNKDNYLAPNTLMSVYARKIKTTNVKHYKRETGVLAWKPKKLIIFCLNLFFEIILYRFKL